MRFLAALLFVLAASAIAPTGNGAAEGAVQACTAADYAGGTCTLRSDDGDDDEWDGGDEGWDDGGPEAECLDRDGKCADYAEMGGCAENPGYMNHHCPRSCGTCDAAADAARAAEFAEEGTFADPCTDSDYRCMEWAGQGECDANPRYMLNNCRHSCVVCQEGTNQFGIGQHVPHPDKATEGDIRRAKARIDQSIRYMQRVWRNDKFRRVRHKCKNQHADCTYWASLGECEANERYMQTNCAPACETCDQLDVRHRCPIEPGNECIWKPGDLNALMENIADDSDASGDYKKYNPQVFSRPKLKRDGTEAKSVEKDGPWVVLLENFVREEEADRLVDIGRVQGYERSADVGKEKPDGSHDSLVSDSRTSHNTWCQERSCYEDPLVVPVIERIANITKTGVTNSEYLQLLQYEPGQYYRQHHDYIPHHRDMPCGVRILTLFIYLNDVEEGGGTRFPLLDITVQPKKGSALLWPSVLDQSPEAKDDRTDHEALPVLKGIKYGANAWIHSRDFKEAFKKNCH